MWDDEGHRLADTVAIAPQQLAKAAGFDIPADRKFIIVHGDGIGEDKQFCKEKLTTLLAVYKYEGASTMASRSRKRLYEVGGKGHSCGISSIDEDHIDYFARQCRSRGSWCASRKSKANAGAFNNGMPMTSSMGCGTWGGNIVSENVALQALPEHDVGLVPIKEDKPSDEELFGEFYDA